MALRQAVGRPLGHAVRSATSSRPAVRTFAATALRAKEVAADSSDAANLRVCSQFPRGQRVRVLVLIRRSARSPRSDAVAAQSRHRQPHGPIQGEGRGAAQIRTVPHVVHAQIHPAVRLPIAAVSAAD